MSWTLSHTPYPHTSPHTHAINKSGNVEVTWCALTQVALIAASGTPVTPVLVSGMVVVVACCCCIPLQLTLMLFLNFVPRAGGVFLPSTGANAQLVHVVISTCCSLSRWCFLLYNGTNTPLAFM